MIILSNKNSVQCGFSTKKSSPSDVLSTLGLSDLPVIKMNQTHSNHVRWIEALSDQREVIVPDTDALLTGLPDVVLCVKTADCLPILLTHPEGLIGVIHAGREGTEKKIVISTLNQALSRVSTAKGFEFWLGPAICKTCYQIDASYDLHYDLIEENTRQIHQCLPKMSPRIVAVNRCTMCEEDVFFSYRREKEKAGRMMGLIARQSL